MYRGWVASRESLVIELPGIIERSGEDIFGNPEILLKTTTGYREACIESIHAAGVKTK